MNRNEYVVHEFSLLCIPSSAQEVDNFERERNECAAEANNRAIHRGQHCADNLHCVWG